jgi:hypothetical protein
MADKVMGLLLASSSTADAPVPVQPVHRTVH